MFSYLDLIIYYFFFNFKHLFHTCFPFIHLTFYLFPDYFSFPFHFFLFFVSRSVFDITFYCSRLFALISSCHSYLPCFCSSPHFACLLFKWTLLKLFSAWYLKSSFFFLGRNCLLFCDVIVLRIIDLIFKFFILKLHCGTCREMQ